MQPWELFVIALVLGLDSFASSIAIGISMCGLTGRQTLRLAGSFLLAHVMMISLGYVVGMTVLRFVDSVDHWIAFSLLFLVGAKFIYEGFKSNGESVDCAYDPTRGKLLFALAVATSIDALVIGGTFPALGIGVFLSAPVVGVVVFLMTFIGTKTYKVVGKRVARHSDFLGGLVLIALGFKIIFEHMGFF